MNPPWFLVSRKGAKAPRNSAPVRRSRFVPRLEALEERSLPSVVPSVTFIDGTVGQPIANQSSSLTASPQPTGSNTYDLNITFSIAYSGSTIGFGSYSSSSSINEFTINIPTSTGSHSALVSGNTNYITFQNLSQTQTASWQRIQLQLNLSSASTDPVALNLGSAVALVASDAASGATLQFTLAGSSNSVIATAGTVMFFSLDSPSTTPMVNSPSGSISGTKPTSAWYFSNPHGPSTLTITLANLSFFASKTLTVQTDVAGYAVFSSVADSLQKNSTTPENNLSKLGNYLPADGFSGQLIMPRMTMSNSLVVGGTTPGFYLTLSVTHEISQRSSSPSAQATWTNLPPPLEAPFARTGSASTKVSWWSGREETNSTTGIIPSPQLPEGNSHAMENMVANILVSLQLTEADQDEWGGARGEGRVQSAQAREMTANNSESQGTNTFFVAFGDEPRADSDPLDNLDNSLNGLLEGMALTDAVPPFSDVLWPEQNTGGTHAFNSKTSYGWGWRVLGECMATVLLALYWPGAIWPHLTPSSKGSKANRSKLSDPLRQKTN
jgi:hypothetical protein